MRIALLSTSDTDLLSGRESGADYVLANPARPGDRSMAEVVEGCDLVLGRLLGSPQDLWPGFTGISAMTFFFVTLISLTPRFRAMPPCVTTLSGRTRAAFCFEAVFLSAMIFLKEVSRDDRKQRRCPRTPCATSSRPGYRG